MNASLPGTHTGRQMFDTSSNGFSFEALIESGAIYRYIIESATEYAVFTADLEGVVRTWNTGARLLMGFEREDMIGNDVSVIFTPEDREENIPMMEIRKALDEGSAIDTRWHMKADGSRFFADGFLMPLRDDMGRTFGFLKILRDRTDWPAFREELKEIEKFAPKAERKLTKLWDKFFKKGP